MQKSEILNGVQSAVREGGRQRSMRLKVAQCGDKIARALGAQSKKNKPLKNLQNNWNRFSVQKINCGYGGSNPGPWAHKTHALTN